jgi:hypothetical protein
MVAVPMKSEYGPTLGQLLAPRWNGLSRVWRWLAMAAGVLLLVAVVGLGLTLENSTYSHGGRVPFSFSYRGLYRVAPDGGGYVKVQARGANGALKYSYAVDPLLIPPYAGELFGALPLYAASYERVLEHRYRGFVLRGEGKTRVSSDLVGYQVLYTAEVEGRDMYGRDVLLLPSGKGAREGVDIVMLTSTTASAQVTSPLEVAGTGVLLRPLKTFAFG